MARCENLLKCPFYQGQMKMDSGLGAMYRKKFCEGDKLTCARYMVFQKLGKEAVPSDLYPNMADKAKEILSRRPS